MSVPLGHEFESLPYNYQQLLKAVVAAGGSLTGVENGLSVIANLHGRKRILFDTESHQTDYSSTWLLDDKIEAKYLLADLQIQVPVGLEVPIVVGEYQTQFTELAKNIGYPVVLKPPMAGMGDGVIADLQTPAELVAGLEILISTYGYTSLLLEKHIAGDEHRIFVTNKGWIAAVKRTPATIIGDGVSTIAQLIETENHRRLHPRTTCLCSIKIDQIVELFLARSNFTTESIPRRGQQVQLRAASNVSVGGFCEDVTDHLHPSVIHLAETIIARLPSVAVLGFDLICRDIAVDLHRQTYAVIELNTKPGLSLHTVPAAGTSRDTPSALLATIFDAK